MQEIKKINVLSVLKISVLFGVLIGIITGVYMYFVLPGMMAANPLTASQASVLDTKTLLAVSATTALTQVIMMIAVSVLGAVFYNLFAGWVGGIKVECIEAQHKKK